MILIFQALSPWISLCLHSQLYQALTAKSVVLLWGWMLCVIKTNPNASQANWHSVQVLSSTFSYKNIFPPTSHAVLAGGQQGFICIPYAAAGSILSSCRKSIKPFTLQIRFHLLLSEIFLSQWAIKIITFNHILQLLHSTKGRLTGLGPDAKILFCD